MTDTTPPRLSSLAFPRTIDLSTGSKNITIGASATDDSSGIKYVIVNFNKSFYSTGSSFYLFGNGDSWSDGSSTIVENISVGTTNGDYRISTVSVYDVAGNQTIYTTDQLTALGIGTTITVTGGDNSGPSVTALNFDRTVDLSGGDATFHFSVSATDRSGITSAVISIASDSGTSLGSYYLFGNTDSWADGTSASTDTIRVSTPPGGYHVTGLSVSDTAGNTTAYTTAQLQALGRPTTLTVTGSDTVGPTLTALDFDRNVDLSGGDATFHFSASAADRSGIGSAVLRVKSASGAYLGSYYIFGNTDSWDDGSSSSTDTISVSTPPGTYSVYEVQVTDKAGNTRVYAQGDLKTLGFPTTFTVGDSDVSGPTLTSFTHPANISLAGGAAAITFGIGATDRSGIGSAVVRFDKDLFGTGGRNAYLFGNTDSWADGASTDTETIPVSTPAGTYTVTSLEVTDKAGNTTIYTTAQLAGLGYSTTVVVGGTDTTGPQLSSLAFPSTVNVSTSAKTVTFAASATDSQTGISDVTIHFDKSFSGGSGRGTIDIAGTTADPWGDGSSSLTTTFPTTTPPGIYTITDVVVTDGAGNQTIYTTAQLQALGLATKVTVTGDSTPPQLTGLTFPASLDVSTGARNQPFTASATDNATGIRDVVIHFDKDWNTGAGTGSVDLSGATDSWADGSSTLVVSIPSTAKTGTYTITGVDVIDGAGNVHVYTTAQLAALGIATSLTITGGTTAPDTTPPDLGTLTFATEVNLATGDKAEIFTANASDAVSGIQTLKIHFDKDLVTGSGPGLVELDGTGDTWADGRSAFNLTIPRTARDGIYTITIVDVIDEAGNVHSYTTSQLTALGIATSLTITGSSVDTTAPELSVLGFPTAIDLSAGAKSANFLAAGTDASSGIANVRITFDKNLLGGAGTGVIDIPGSSNDPWTDGSSAFVQVIPTTARNGTYTVTGVDMTDVAGNVRHYTTGELTALGLNTSLTITGAQPPGGTDTIGPQIASLQYSGVFDLSTGDARFDLYAPATDQTGVRQGVLYLDHQIRISNGSGSTGTTNGFAFGSDGHVASYFTGALTSPIYQIDHIDYYDTNNVLRTYTTLDLAAFGLQTGFFILTASYNVSITAVFGGTYFNDTLTGTSVNNVLYGLQGNDVLISGGGVDWLYGGLGNDAYYISTSATHIIELAGEGTADIVYTSVSYTLEIGQEIEFLSASSISTKTAINLFGNEFANTITGNAGDNILRGGLGNDRLDGGRGIDTADFSDKTTSVVVSLNGSKAVSVTIGGIVEDTILNIENVIGGSGADRLVGDGLSNLLVGGAGADKLFGSNGDDVLRGGLGKDRLDGGSGFDTADFSDKTAVVVVTLNGDSAVSVKVGGVVEDTILKIENIVGGSAGDSLTGDGLANLLDGGLGADTLRGLGGNDVYVVDNLRDKVVEVDGQGSDTIQTSISYALVAGQSIETLRTTSDTGIGAINLTGNEIVNKLVGNDGANILDGKAGADLLYGRGGDDTFIISEAGDRVFETADGGNDTVQTAVSYVLATGQSIETLRTLSDAGTAAIDLTGNDVANKLVGNAGANVLAGGGAADQLYGRAGADTFLFKTLADSTVAASGRDTIQDFSTAQGDRIDLHLIDAVSGGTVNQAFKFIGAADFHHRAGELNATISGGNTLVSGDVDGDGAADFSILLKGVLTLHSGDFNL